MRTINYYLCIFIFLWGSIGCTQEKGENRTIGYIPVKVYDVKKDISSEEQNYVGTIEELYGSSLSFPIIGNVEKVLIQEGEPVKKGQLLAVLDKTSLQSTYDATYSSLLQAKDAYERMSKLYDNKSLPEIKWIEVQNSLQKAISMEEIAKKNLQDANLYAPFDGIISKKNVEIGMNVTPGIPIFNLVKIEKVNIKIPVPENEISNIKKGDIALIKVAALNNRIFEGKISEKGIIANPISHTYDVKILLDNPTLDLIPGMVCKVNIPKNNMMPEIIIPNHAIQIDNSGKSFVWLANKETAQLQIITTGRLAAKGIVVTEGLKEGDKLIIEGNQKVSNGSKIIIK
ncbi:MULTISPECIES: efflux RND transporter periplasmic adaptor subunit [Bacteroidales]|uniref:efflux RND transporter periplasmic adaptor subunit n=1 Tax=Bacteroidales TaxID=171549 RepID=UPI000573AE22|nr:MULTISPECIES: efflux RND transporter periplasmic adaptor subunit [Bacteroidales]KHM45725.1 hypothetical protein PU94_11320 [Coprobacter secundus]